MSAPEPRSPLPGPHGGDVERIGRLLGVDPRSLLDLSVSLNPVAPDVSLLAEAHLDSLRRYPDADGPRRQLAEAIGVEPETLLLTNGGAEAITMLAAEVGGQVDEPEFSLHPRGSGMAPRWRSNPHNPTGRLAGPEERADVWDEAFFPLATGRWTRGDHAAMATVGSLTKLFACPGLRLGYVLAPPDLIRALATRQPHWSVGGLALAVLPELLALADLPGWALEISDLRRELTELLDRYGLSPHTADANYMLCQGTDSLRDRLLTRGVVVRDCASFGLPGLVRVAVPNHCGLERLASALEVITS